MIMPVHVYLCIPRPTGIHTLQCTQLFCQGASVDLAKAFLPPLAPVGSAGHVY